MKISKEKEILGDYANKGYSIEENTDHFTILFKDSMVAVRNQPKITPKEIQDICRRHKEGLMGPKV